jgi:RNA polymerase sigma factor (sigma-70 family)
MNNARGSLSSTDQQLIENLCQEGAAKRKGEEQLFNTYAYFIREGMHKYSLTEDEAFDAYADTILSAIENIRKGSFEGRSSLKTWLYQVFFNKCVDLLRKRSTNKNSVYQTTSISDMLLQLSDSGKSVIQTLIDKSDADLLKQKLTELGDTCRQLLTLSADGYTDKEISTVMEYKTADVVKTSRLRCLDKLRQLYKTTLKT